MGRGSAKLRAAVKSKYWSPAQAQVVVEAWRDSGESMRRFAARWSISRPRLSRWVARLGSTDGDSVDFLPVRALPSPAAAVARPLSSTDSTSSPAQGSWIAELTTGPWTVRVPRCFDRSELACLLRIVAEVESC